jgi:hypothetical protein
MVIKALEDLSFEDLNTPPEREKVAEQTKASPAKEGAAEVKQAKAEPGGPPQMVTLDAAQGKASGMYTPVEFDHALHMATGGCTDCHHSYEQTGAYQPCSSCHQPQAEAASAKLSLYNAYHNQQGQASCLGCHLEAQSGPTGCQGCHIPD